MTIIRIGLDTSKHVFQIHGVDENEKPVLRRQLRRSEVEDREDNDEQDDDPAHLRRVEDSDRESSKEYAGRRDAQEIPCGK